MYLRRFGYSVRHFLDQPSKAFVLCLIFLVLSFVFDGILWRLWGLSRDQARLQSQSIELRSEIVSLHKQLRQAKDPSFIERQARDKLDLAAENDLVFVFPD
jgi:cell division protein FtsB